MAFNAGSIEATLTLNRTAFTAGLKAAKAEAERFARQRFDVTITPKLDRAGLTKIKEQIEKVTGNVSVKVKLDNTSLQAVKQRIDRTVGNINVKVKLDNSSLQAVRARINSVAGRVEVKARLDNASLQAIRARINSVAGKINVKVGVDAASIAALRARIDRLRLNVKVGFTFDNSDLQRLRAELALFRPTIKVRVEYDRSSINQLGSLFGGAGRSIGGASSQMRILIALLPLLLTVGAPAITGLIGLLGALTSIIGIAAAGLGAFGLVGAKVFSTINQNAEKTKTAVKGISSAYDQVAAARERLTQVVEQSAAQNEAAEQRVADAREQLSRTTESAARADVAAEERVADAHKNVAKAIQSAARDNEAAQERVASARENLSEAIQSAARADAEAEERVVNAQEDLADVIAATARANEAAQEQIADARRSLSEAVESAAQADIAAEERVAEARKDLARTIDDVAQANVSAQRRVESAERSLTRTQDAAKKAQEDLNQARKDAIEDLEDLKLSLRGAALSEEQAVIDLADAQKKYNQALHEGTTGTELKQLELDVRKAKLQLDESRESLGDLKQKSDEYAKSGIEGSEGVKNAQEKVVAANEDIKDAERDVADAREEAARTALEGQQKILDSQESITKAQKEANQTHIDGQRDILKAQEALTRTQKDANQTALDGQKNILDAQEKVSKAQQDATQTALDGQKSIQKAQEEVAKSQKEAAQTALDGQERVLEAQQELAKAQKEATQTHLDGQRDILDAQKAVAEAQKEAARVALENQRQIAAATRDLVEAQKAYNEAVGEMPKKLLPGMKLAEDALIRLKAAYQALVDRTSPATGRAFAAFFDAGTAALNTLDPLINATAASLERFGLKAKQYFGTEDWKVFVDFLSQHVGPTLDKLFDAASHLMGGIKGLVVAFQPLADWLLDKIVKGLTDFDTWANNLANDPAFQKWLKDVQVDLKLLWDFLVQVVTFIARLVRDLEPFGRPIMQGLVNVLTFLNSLPPGMLGAIAVGFSAIMTALMLGAGGPVSLGIGALVAAGAAIAYLAKTSPEAQAAMEGFTTWLQQIWNPIWETIKTNFEEKIKPAFDRLVAVVRDDLWPAMQRFGAVIVEEVLPKIQPLIDTITGTLIPALIDFLTALEPIVKYLLDTWGPVIADVLGRTVTIFDGSLKTIAGIVQTVTGLISGDWDKFGQGLHTIAEGFWTIVAGLFGTNLDGLKKKFDEADANIRRIWGGVGDWMAGIGSDFISHVQQRFSEFGPWVSQRTQEAADGIGRAWRAVANFFREPINWVINVVMNDGILRAWNQVMGWIGQPALSAAPIAQIPAFASGGEVQGPGTGTSDSILARVSAGEYIVPASVAQANMGLLNSLQRFQTGGEIATGSAGATVAPGTTATAQSQSWWSRVGTQATELFNNIIRGFSAMPGYNSIIGGYGIAKYAHALVDKVLNTLYEKLSVSFPPAAPGATALDPYGNDPRQSAVFDRGGVLRPKTKAINTAKQAERVLSPQQTQDFNQLIKILNDMFHPSHTTSPSGGDVYHITLPKGATVRELANEINFRKKVSAKGRYSPR